MKVKGEKAFTRGWLIVLGYFRGVRRRARWGWCGGGKKGSERSMNGTASRKRGDGRESGSEFGEVGKGDGDRGEIESWWRAGESEHGNERRRG